MKLSNGLRKKFAGVALGSAVAVGAIGIGAAPVDAASWTKDTHAATQAECEALWYARAGSVNFMRHSSGNCYVNWTLTNSDNSLTNPDTFQSGVDVATARIVSVNIASNTVTIWGNTSCSGTFDKQTISAYFITTASHYSYKRNSSADGC